MKKMLFDMDGVLIDKIPSYAEAFWLHLKGTVTTILIEKIFSYLNDVLLN